MIPLPQAKLLVVGYGNTLRGDDGVGQCIAIAIEAMGLPEVRTIVIHQLAPELAETISRIDTVVFVDAAVGIGNEVRVSELQPQNSAAMMAHAPAPGTLLALTRHLYGRAPHAWLLSIPVANLAFGEALSDLGKRGVATAVEIIRSRWLVPALSDADSYSGELRAVGSAK
jgi:hydrogenase maturation protease